MRGVYGVYKDGRQVGQVEMDDRLARRLKHVRRIEDAPVRLPEPPRGWRKVWAYLRARWSKVAKGPTPEAAAAARLEACRSCEHRQVVDGKGEFCGRCGCGNRRSAELTIKVTMPAATCPIGKWPA